jgi:hypothetical protein
MRGWAPIFIVAVIVRVALLASPVVPPAYVMAGYHVEVEAVARSLASGGGYANPYAIPTGPTAHPLPVQTGLQAFLYLCLGVTYTAACARALLGIVACAALFAILPWAAERLGLGRRAGVIGGAAAALVPLQGLADALGWYGNEAETGIALCVLLALFVARCRSSSPPRAAGSAALGALAGFSFHLAPALLPVVLGLVAFEAWWMKRRGTRGAVLALALGAAIACAPWAWRNYAAFGELFFIRSNLGLELWLGNHEGASADLWATDGGRRLHPGNSVEEARRVAALGEIEYMRRARDAAVSWARSHPREFLSLTAARVWHVWFGPPARPVEALPVAALTILALVGLIRAFRYLGPPERAALLIPLAGYPLLFYFVGYVPRYTFPLVGILLILAGVGVSGPSRVGGRPACR